MSRANQILAAGGDTLRANDVVVRLRGTTMYWIMVLAEAGLDKRVAEMKGQKYGPDASDIASMVSWQDDLDALTTEVLASLKNPPRRRAKKK